LVFVEGDSVYKTPFNTRRY